VTDRPGFYHALDAFLLPSLHEGLPMALLEAMASGVPVLASRLEGIAAALAEDEEGLLAGAGALEEFAAKLARLENEPGLRTKLAGAARTKAESFSASRTAHGVEAVYYAELGIAPARGTDRYSRR
jgi:glycosyltransferase involved in cell wall biosynthesis